MDDPKDFIKISYPVERDSWDGASSEGIWVKLVKALPPHQAIVEVQQYSILRQDSELRRQDFRVYHEGRVKFDAVVDRGGHSTYHVFVERKNADASRMLDTIKAIGGGWEEGKHLDGHSYALDIPPEVDIDDVHESLIRVKGKDIGIFRKDMLGIREEKTHLPPSCNSHHVSETCIFRNFACGATYPRWIESGGRSL